jgi:hypothetical protein
MIDNTDVEFKLYLDSHIHVFPLSALFHSDEMIRVVPLGNYQLIVFWKNLQ